MTQQEFTKRTKVEVNTNEFEAIHVVYMASDLDKDEFCKVWCKMNKSRVEKARADRMLLARTYAYQDALYKFYVKNNTLESYTTPISYSKITEFEIRALSFAGIVVADEYGTVKFMSQVCYEIGEYLGLYK